VTASSTNSTGMLSRIGYTRRHSPHLRLCPSSLTTSGFLHTGHTRIASRSLSIMAQILRRRPAEGNRMGLLSNGQLSIFNFSVSQAHNWQLQIGNRQLEICERHQISQSGLR
jgi:hypothetical protein